MLLSWKFSCETSSSCASLSIAFGNFGCSRALNFEPVLSHGGCCLQCIPHMVTTVGYHHVTLLATRLALASLAYDKLPRLLSPIDFRNKLRLTNSNSHIFRHSHLSTTRNTWDSLGCVLLRMLSNNMLDRFFKQATYSEACVSERNADNRECLLSNSRFVIYWLCLVSGTGIRDC